MPAEPKGKILMSESLIPFRIPGFVLSAPLAWSFNLYSVSKAALFVFVVCLPDCVCLLGQMSSYF